VTDQLSHNADPQARHDRNSIEREGGTLSPLAMGRGRCLSAKAYPHGLRDAELSD
jgi:hypothetical protein